MTVILASSSPRRKELLQKSVEKFLIKPADIDETVAFEETPLDYVERMAKEKATVIVADYPNDIVIGCDTTVVLEELIMGKPESDDDARDVLRQLSGACHQVLTSVYIATPTEIFQKTECVDVYFYDLESEDIENYLATGEHRDKAGSYGIQGQGALFVKEIKGDYYSIVGFPIGYVHQVLKKIL
ncbi:MULTISPECIES: Maf family protein [Vagococcus]|uniref:dTTP/UTP pyrophosphatase n=1 Tax=Vagococcus fluvialis bH819 TaxID=1255619 RepID=A0A1X6WPH7_9ENTE|nr:MULTISPECIES: Maf family protein [Vagococcus]SLM85566.1 Septum formation protein Maf [Vagococcus fluvialis bH819]HCM89534.1 septum formation protein Maf [Vagococcus sp.]